MAHTHWKVQFWSRNSDANADCYGYGYRYGYCYCYCYFNTRRKGYSDAETSADSPSASLRAE